MKAKVIQVQGDGIVKIQFEDVDAVSVDLLGKEINVSYSHEISLLEDYKEFINWVVQEIYDYDQLLYLVKRAVENPFDMNKGCEKAIELFLDYVRETAYCDHSVGICNCELIDLLY